MVKSSLVPREAPGALNVELSVVRQLGVGGALPCIIRVFFF